MKDFLPRTHFSEEHEMFRDMVRGFVEKEVAPNVERWHEEGMPDRELFKKAGELGLIGMSTPEEYGGGGEMDFRYHQVLNAALTTADSGSIVVGMVLTKSVEVRFGSGTRLRVASSSMRSMR